MALNIKKEVKAAKRRIVVAYQNEGVIGLAKIFVNSVCIDGQLPLDAKVSVVYHLCTTFPGGIAFLKAVDPKKYYELVESGLLKDAIVILHTHCLALTELGIIGDEQIPFIDCIYAELLGAGADVRKSDFGSA